MEKSLKYFVMEEDLYYQSTKSNIKFYAQSPDPENVGLEDYRKSEIEKIQQFVKSDSKVLVVGGVSSTTKSYVLEKVAKEEGFLFYDLGSLSHEDHQILSIMDPITIATVVSKMILKAIYLEAHSGIGNNGIILDEGMIMISQNHQNINFTKILTELLNRQPKVILSGGGSDFTGEEQVEMLSSHAPKSEALEQIVFPLKHLNLKQLISLICVTQKVDIEIATVVAETLHTYFRLPRVISSKLRINVRNGIPYIPVANINLNGLMPSEVHDPLWREQEDIWYKKGWL